MKKSLKFSLPLSLSGLLLFAKPAFAHCPLCVAGAGAGLSLSRVIGIDDSITGIWMGAFLGAMSFWINNSIKRSFFPFQRLVIYLAIFVSTVISFYRFGLINEHNGLILNLPKLTFGIIVGGVLFYVMDFFNSYLKTKKGKVLFPYQSIVISLGSIFLMSVGMYILLNYFI